MLKLLKENFYKINVIILKVKLENIKFESERDNRIYLNT